jgi:hypothetical protein
MAFGDRRLTDGVKLPHRVTTTARSLARGARSISEDFTFTKVFVNPPLTPADLSKAP